MGVIREKGGRDATEGEKRGERGKKEKRNKGLVVQSIGGLVVQSRRTGGAV